MATTSANVAPNNATAAEFRAWAQFVHDVFANGGWVQTADTGQINLATVGAPGAANTKMGYELWAMDDAHQATNPVILKLAYGSGSGTNFPAIWFTVGTESDGAGNLIDSNDGDRPAYLVDFYTQTAAPIFSRSNSATTHTSFGSADTDRAVFVLFESKPTLRYTGTQCEFVNITAPDTSAVGNFVNAFSIERGRDANGDTVADYIFIQWTTTSTNGVFGAHQYVSTRHDVIPHNHLWGTISTIPPGEIQVYAQSTDAQLPADGAAYGIVPWIQSTQPTWPGINAVVTPNPIFEFDPHPGNCTVAFDATYITGRTSAVSPYGVARTYRTVAGIRGGQFGAGNRETGAFIHILYE